MAAADSLNGNNSSSIDGQPTIPSSGNLLGSFIWVIVSLVIVITLIIFVIKWLSQRNRVWGSNQRSLRTLGGIALGQNKSMQVIELGGKLYVVGVGEEITLLDKIDKPEEVELIVDMFEQKASNNWQGSNLGTLINKLRDRVGRQSESKEEWNTQSSFQHVLQDKLNQQATHKQKLESLLKDSKSDDRLMDDEK
ncbi:flagellar biosynthetic protein FliO [Paenibacillus sp. GCM10023252]